MAKRYELRVDDQEFKAMQRKALEVGCASVAEYLRKLHRDELGRATDDAIAYAMRDSSPKVT